MNHLESRHHLPDVFQVCLPLVRVAHPFRRSFTLHKVLKVVSSESLVSFSVWKTCPVSRLFSYLSSLSMMRCVFIGLFPPLVKCWGRGRKWVQLYSHQPQRTPWKTLDVLQVFMLIIWLHSCESVLISTIAFLCHFQNQIFFFSFCGMQINVCVRHTSLVVGFSLFFFFFFFFFTYSLLKSFKMFCHCEKTSCRVQ